ncbi:3' terminal RNA ribose 2'-O-methyltransferase Hen1 [Microbispora sp. NPDC049125]|uniref:3' terminal RNA ribose 2'-O-methyltransferase Hen1 n=1 Tax=Microbispora sp. NPDC049125 TaxID=3154929 RepID=UPI0034661F5C
MLLTITTTLRPATDLGFLLHKHPDRVQEFDRSFGVARVFYPEAGEERCTAALLLEVDPVRLARSRGSSSPDFSLGQYVNDRPYAASSLLAAALADVFRTARAGRCASRQELADGPIPLELALPALPCRGGADLARRLFEPLGWEVDADAVPLDEGFPDWGDSRYVRLALRGWVRLADALNHLYVLLPVLDDAKHYWLADDEVDKLIRAGEGWLAAHPDKALITRRYLGKRRTLARTAFARLAEVGDDVEEALEPPVEEDAAAPPESAVPPEPAAPERSPVAEVAEVADASVPPTGSGGPEPEEPRTPLNVVRRDAVVSVLREIGARTVVDLGCGSGQLLTALLADTSFAKVTGMDVSAHALTMAGRRLKIDRMPDAKRARLELFQGSLTYTDARLGGHDAAVLMEVVEHVDPPRLPALEHVVFGVARPAHVIVTTPNVEHNVRYEFLAAGGGAPARRHPDHRFEWTRAEFAEWASGVCDRHGYTVELRRVGDDDPEVGPPTQMAVFALSPAAAVPREPAAAVPREPAAAVPREAGSPASSASHGSTGGP